MKPTDTITGNDEALHEANDRLKHLIARTATVPGQTMTAIEGLTLIRWHDTSRIYTCCTVPAIGIVVQGGKEAFVGSEKFRYGALTCVVNGVEMPCMNTILEASPDMPLLAVSLDIDRTLAVELAAEVPPTVEHTNPVGVSITQVTLDILKAFIRLVELLDKPEQQALRAPILIREIITRILIGPQGPSLRMIHTARICSNQIAQVISWLRENYTRPLHVEELVARTGMPLTSFYRQFKTITSLSPLQYQKCLRLYEAQRLMLNHYCPAKVLYPTG